MTSPIRLPAALAASMTVVGEAPSGVMEIAPFRALLPVDLANQGGWGEFSASANGKVFAVKHVVPIEFTTNYNSQLWVMTGDGGNRRLLRDFGLIVAMNVAVALLSWHAPGVLPRPPRPNASAYGARSDDARAGRRRRCSPTSVPRAPRRPLGAHRPSTRAEWGAVYAVG